MDNSRGADDNVNDKGVIASIYDPLVKAVALAQVNWRSVEGV